MGRDKKMEIDLYNFGGEMPAATLNKIRARFQQDALKVPCSKAEKTLTRILELMKQCPTMNSKQSWSNIIKKVELTIMKSSFYITTKGDRLVDELYNDIKNQEIDLLVKEESFVYQAQCLTLVYYKRVLQLKERQVDVDKTLERFLKTVMIYVCLNNSLQMQKLSKKLTGEGDDFVFEPNLLKPLLSPVNELNKLYLYQEYLKEISQIVTTDFSNEIEYFFEKITIVAKKNDMPIDFKTYKWIKERYDAFFLKERSAEPALENYLWVLLYDEVAKRRYILNTKSEISEVSQARKAIFKDLFYSAEQLTLECTAGKSSGLFGPMLYVNGGYDSERSEFSFEFMVNVHARQLGEMYYINNLSNVVLQFTYSAVNEVTALKLLNRIRTYDEDVLEKSRMHSELFGLYSWLFSYSMSAVPKEIDEWLDYKIHRVEDYYTVVAYEREKVCALFDVIEDILYYKKSVLYRVLLEVNNTIVKPQEKDSYYDADYDATWGENHVRWRDVVKTDYRWRLDHCKN